MKSIYQGLVDDQLTTIRIHHVSIMLFQKDLKRKNLHLEEERKKKKSIQRH